MQPKHPHSDLIDRVGRDVVVRHFELSPQRLHMWRTRGVPLLRRIAFTELAAKRGIVVPADFLEPLSLVA